MPRLRTKRKRALLGPLPRPPVGRRGTVETIPLPRSPRDVAVGEGYVWVMLG